MALAAKRKLFADEYLADPKLNATEAYKRAGYKAKNDNVAAVEASNLLKDPKVAAYIQERMDARQKRTEITQDRVLREIAAGAFFDPGVIGAHKITCPGDIQNLPEEVRRAIVGWSWDKFGNFVIKLASKGQALDQLARHLSLYNDKLDINVKEGLADRMAKARKRANKD